jgi:hypothetical protein
MMLYSLHSRQRPSLVISSYRNTPPPPWGQGWLKEGACGDGNRIIPVTRTVFPPRVHFFQNFFRQFGFPTGKIRAYKLSTGKNLDFKNFKPEKNLPEKF